MDYSANYDKDKMAKVFKAGNSEAISSRKFPDFFQPIGAATDGNLLGSSAPSVEDAMNAQIRALTKGDVIT